MSRGQSVTRNHSPLRTIGICLAGGLVTPLFSCTACLWSFSVYYNVAFVTALLWLAMWFGIEFISHSLDDRIPWTTKPITRFVVGIIVVSLYTVLVTWLITQVMQWTFGRSFGDFSAMIYITLTVTFIITLFMTSRQFLFNWRQTAVNAEKLLQENLNARYENLKSQVNPHFLFNSLNALANLVYEDQDKAVKFIKQLSDVYRYVLDTRNQEVVPLAEELQFLNSYIFLQQIRFGDKLKVELNLNGTQSLVAPLSLQMLFENAIKHNVVSKDNPLHIKVWSDHQYISVENNLQRRLTPEERSTGLGLDNIRRRYEYISDKAVVVDENEATFTVRLPVINKKNQ